MKKYRLAIVETHPIQYKAPLFRLLSARPDLEVKVYYAMIPDAAQQGSGFDVPFVWDVPLLDEYAYQVLNNRARQPSVSSFGGCDTPDIYSRLKRDCPDAVLVNGWVVKTCLQALWACKRLNIPCLVRGEANLLRPRARWKHVLHRLLMHRYDGWLAIGSASREFYRFHRCPEERIFWAPYAVDNGFFAAQAAALQGRRQEWRVNAGVPEDAVLFLFVGKLIAKKRPQDILAAVARLPAEEKARVHVLFAGDGPLRAECERQARAEQLPVTFAGFLNQSQLPAAYAASDVLVLPSDAGETWGLVVNEAMASGRPAVVSRAVGCCADLIVENRTGHSFACGNLVELAHILGAYARAPELACEQGRAAAEHIRGFGLDVTAAGIAQAVQQTCSHGERSC